MVIFIIILLGVVQGASEFLPISSSGHLVVFYNIFNISDNVLLLSIILHLGTLLAVLIVYKNDIIALIKKPFNKTNMALLISTLVTVVMVLLFKRFIASTFDGSHIVLFFLITAGVLLVAQLVSENKNKLNSSNQFAKNNTSFHKTNNKQNIKSAELKSSSSVTKTNSFNESNNSSVLHLNVSYFQAVLIGFAQGLATVPGVSRSGLTISMALLVGVNKNDAPTYSFLMSIPIILASLLYEVLDIADQTTMLAFTSFQLVVGFVVSFLVGYLCLKVMISFVKKQKLYVFSIYLAVLSLFLTLNQHFFKLF